MTKRSLENINIQSQTLLPTPREFKERYPLSEKAQATVANARQTIQAILEGRDKRLLVIVGPCSIHDVDAAIEYAKRLRGLAEELKDQLYLVMRVYFEKPRTTVGWKGLINDPRLDGSFQIEEGLTLARQLLINLADLGVPAGIEALDPITPQYFGELVAWTAIGARTAESQTHREMSSGLSSPVGFKNGTDGNLTVAINAMLSVSNSHHFLGIDQEGRCAITETAGNQYGHIILRGGDRPNYDSVSIAMAEKALRKAGLPENIIVDCSHANSNKDAQVQMLVLRNCVGQILDGNRSIRGVMLESNLHFGQQALTENPAELRYGVSITDSCIDWEKTQTSLQEAANRLQNRA